MNDQQRRINWPALGAATALALAITFGVPAAMSAGTNDDAYLPTLAAGSATKPAVVMAQEPLRIEVVATREHNTVRGFWFTSHKPQG